MASVPLARWTLVDVDDQPFLDYDVLRVGVEDAGAEYVAHVVDRRSVAENGVKSQPVDRVEVAADGR